MAFPPAAAEINDYEGSGGHLWNAAVSFHLVIGGWFTYTTYVLLFDCRLNYSVGHDDVIAVLGNNAKPHWLPRPAALPKNGLTH